MSIVSLGSTINRKEMSNILLFSLGKLISLFGTSIYIFAIGLYVLKETGSGLSFATTLVLGMLPIVLITPFAGVLADKLNKKLLVVLMDIFNGLLFIGLYFISGKYGLNIFMIYTSIVMMSIFTTIFGISMETGKPNIVTEKNLMNINSISKIIDSTSIILGPMVGGFIYAFIDIRLFIIINGITFIFSGITEMFIDFKLNEELLDKKDKIRLFDDITDGFRYLKNKQQIISLLIILIAVNFFISYAITVPLPYIINNVLGLKPEYFGIIEAAFPVGMIIGAILVKRFFEKLNINKLFLSANFVIAISMIMIGLPVLPHNIAITTEIILIYYIVIMIFLGIAISFIDIPLLYILQSRISTEYRGRVLGLGMSIAKIVAPLGLILSGWLINLLPAAFSPIFGGILFIIFNLVYVKNRSMKECVTDSSSDLEGLPELM